LALFVFALAACFALEASHHHILGLLQGFGLSRGAAAAATSTSAFVVLALMFGAPFWRNRQTRQGALVLAGGAAFQVYLDSAGRPPEFGLHGTWLWISSLTWTLLIIGIVLVGEKLQLIRVQLERRQIAESGSSTP
jgi:hypothetical protein